MDKTSHIFVRFAVSVIAVGTIGNILVIISILRQKSVLKNNYYFLVLHLTICDMGTLIFYFPDYINKLDEGRSDEPKNIWCLGAKMRYIFRVGGIGIMLVISMFRYRATVHPLKPAITRKKVKVICGLVYIVSFILGYGATLPLCLISKKDVANVYEKFRIGYVMLFFYFLPTIFMAAIYYKIGRALVNQSKDIKNVCSNPVRQRSTPNSSLNIQRFIRNRKTFFVCIITVLCYGVGNIPISVLFVKQIVGENNALIKDGWFWYLAIIVRVGGSHSVNPLVYGLLDKKLLKILKLCRKKKYS